VIILTQKCGLLSQSQNKHVGIHLCEIQRKLLEKSFISKIIILIHSSFTRSNVIQVYMTISQ